MKRGNKGRPNEWNQTCLKVHDSIFPQRIPIYVIHGWIKISQVWLFFSSFPNFRMFLLCFYFRKNMGNFQFQNVFVVFFPRILKVSHAILIQCTSKDIDFEFHINLSNHLDKQFCLLLLPIHYCVLLIMIYWLWLS